MIIIDYLITNSYSDHSYVDIAPLWALGDASGSSAPAFPCSQGGGGPGAARLDLALLHRPRLGGAGALLETKNGSHHQPGAKNLNETVMIKDMRSMSCKYVNAL